MKINRVQEMKQDIIFKANISPRFEKFMRDYINCGTNRLQRNCKLNKKLGDLKNFGYDDYFIHLVDKPVSWGKEFILVASKNPQTTTDAIFLLKAGSLNKMINIFLDMNKNKFKWLMKKNNKYKK